MEDLPVRSSALALLALMVLPALSQAPLHAPDGNSRERIQSISISAKAGAPFRATVVADLTHQLADGTTSTMKSHRLVARDSSGRIFEERRFFSPEGDKQETQLSNLQYTDPTRKELYDCVPARHVCVVTAYVAPASAAPAQSLPAGAGTAQTNAKTGTTIESLGERSIENVEAVGSREIWNLPAGVIGNSRAEPIVKEFWYSPRLDINLIVKRFDPRAGAQNFTVEDLDLTEPDPRLFVPPAGYKTVHMDQ